MTDLTFYRNGGEGTLHRSPFKTNDPCTMRQIATNTIVEYPPPCEIQTIVEYTDRLLHDETLPQSVEALIGEDISDAFKKIEGKAFMVGIASNEPQGVFTSERIQRLRTCLSNDSVIDLYYALDVRHRASAVFLCNPKTVLSLMELTDADGRFLFKQGLSAGDLDRLFDVPIYADPDAPDNRLAIGDFIKGYQTLSSPKIKIIRDPHTAAPSVLFHASHKVGGSVTNDEAIKILEWSNNDTTVPNKIHMARW